MAKLRMPLARTWIFIATKIGHTMKITVGHTPDADDAFMFYGMLSGLMPTSDFDIIEIIDDIETLNQRARKGDLDVTAASVHACASISGYTILRSGGSFGLGYGPIVVAQDNFDVRDLPDSKIAIPGKMTSAYLLLQLMIGRFDYVEMDFTKIPSAVEDGIVDAGLVIHEGQITYAQHNIAKILDTGEWWDKETGGLPVPLGINVIKTSLGYDTIRKFDRYFQDSIKYGLANSTEAIKFAMKYGRDNTRELIDKFVKMYVNPVTVDMGDGGERAIQRMFQMAQDADLVPEFDLKVAPHLN